MPVDTATPTTSPDPSREPDGGGPTHTVVSRLALINGQLVFRKLGTGTFEECERLADGIPALAWGGSVAVHQADLLTMPSSDWADIGQGHDVVSYTLSDEDGALARATPSPGQAGADGATAGGGADRG